MTSSPDPAEPGNDVTCAPAAPGFRQACAYWLRLGFISFGGPAGQISIMHQDLVERRRWISEHRFLHALNYTMLLPGPEAQQLATYIGWLLHGTTGGLVAGVLFVLPSLLIMMTLAGLYVTYNELPVVSGLFYGVKPAVVAIVLAAAHRIGTRSLATPFARLIAVLAFLALSVGHVPFPMIVAGAGVAGFIVARFRPAWLAVSALHENASRAYGAALIDDDTPIPDHARFNWRHAVTFAVVGMALWCTVSVLLLLKFGWLGTFTQMGWFFTKAALLTFGGAYAVLPYVYQGAVQQFQWLTATQMIDGLALGEATPGPLIMIVAFVGFIGGWNAAPLAPGMPVFAAVAGACTATFFTFLPSFIFIFVGAPAVEATRHELRVSAPLAAITAAVVGVVLNLAVFFAHHVFWPQGLDEPVELPALVLGLLATVALFRLRAGIIPLIAAAAAAGLVLKLAGVVP
ncbi:MAG: chromate transporter [Gammaproteobacteria bacterium RIFCSPLOWO2_02_FULL_61_13]|nr:MAG: chromate transporter [Gammaproteobacteria bacterium RIFCSPLOWO2_02_FULL_61_13]